MGMAGAPIRQILLATNNLARSNMCSSHGQNPMRQMNTSTLTLKDMHGPLGQELHHKNIRTRKAHAHSFAPPDGRARTPNANETRVRTNLTNLKMTRRHNGMMQLHGGRLVPSLRSIITIGAILEGMLSANSGR